MAIVLPNRLKLVFYMDSDDKMRDYYSHTSLHIFLSFPFQPLLDALQNIWSRQKMCHSDQTMKTEKIITIVSINSLSFDVCAHFGPNLKANTWLAL